MSVPSQEPGDSPRSPRWLLFRGLRITRTTGLDLAPRHDACVRRRFARIIARWSKLLPEPLLQSRVQQVAWQQCDGERGR